MSTYQTVYGRGIAFLTEASVPDAKTDAWYLLSHVTGLQRAVYLMKAQEEMPEEEVQQYERLIEKRAGRIPLQYITGVQEFMGFEFAVSASTLIPRQDTEVLVEEVVKYAGGKRILDLCTGTGCIIISLKKLCNLSYAAGSDLLPLAVATAKKNAEKLDANVDFYCGDLFEAIPTGERFDIIVSNPPYIPSEVITTLMPEVREHEPVTALDGDTDGLKFYRSIICQAGQYLEKNGRIFFEIGSEQAADVSKLLLEAGFEEICVKKDYAGLDRVVSAVWSQE
ncbi:MAG: peptide chain release factor N(5)-glutamine methyltransferase [Lachnospiraceae bacterium]|nr:peptide chain release factor N(5)-glutamine methyltransferase [Lachnospiraceae bacterium]